MQFKTYIQSKLPLYLALSSLFVLASCGSYQYVGNNSDGIYGTSDAEADVQTEDAPVATESNAFYKGYFAEKSDKYARIANEEDDVIFTDIDAYEGTYNDQTGEVEYEEGYAGWGQDSDNVTINVYSNYGWNGWYSPWRYGWGWNSWYSPWYYGYGWNWGWHGYYGYYNPYYGYGYYGGYYSPYYYGYNPYRGHYYNRNVAYNAGRRGSYVNQLGRSSYRNDQSLQTTRRNATTTRRSSDTRYNPETSIRTTTRRNNSSIRSNNSTRSNTRVNAPARNTRSNTNTRVHSPSRSSSSSTIRSSSPSRSSSSGTSRRSGSSSRRGGRS